MSKSLGRILSSPRAAVSRCRRPSAGCKLQIRSFSEVQQSPRPSSSSPQPALQPKTPRASSTRDINSPSLGQLEQHLNSLFPPLKFPPELAARILTHASHPDSIHRHNGRLSFIGRRVLQSYLFLFLHDSPSLRPSHDYSMIADRTLNTYVLGEHVAPLWSLGKVLKWVPVPSVPLSKTAIQEEGLANTVARLGPEASRSVGLYKVQGMAVEALVGGIFHQFGGSAAHRLFHTRVLPNILLPGRPEGLNDVFYKHAMEVCEKMGGSSAELLVAHDAESEAV